MEQLIKRIIALTIAIITLVSAWAYDFKVDNIYYYKMTDTEIRVTYRYYDSSSNNYAYTGEIIIPEKVTYNGKEYSVTSIGDYAFSWCTGLTSVTIPNSVTSIGNRAFYNCTGLTSVTIPNSVTEIGDNAFYNCTSLRSVVFNATNCTIYGSSNVRPFPSSITSLTIGNNVTTIPDYFLYGFSKIETITIPNSVTKIGSSSFRDCSGLTSVTIPNSVTTIGSYAFTDCSGLTSVIIPNSVTSIGDNAFSGCRLIKSAYPTSLYNPFYYNVDMAIGYPAKGSEIENGVIYGPDKSAIYFVSCDLKGDFTIPNSVTSIGNGAFSSCTRLASVTIPNSVTSIGSNAFYNCSGLISVTIPNSVTSIGTNAFSVCTNLASLEFNATNCISCGSSNYPAFPSSIASLTIGNNVTSIPDYFLYNGSKIESLTIPNSVISIGKYAFYGSKLKSLTIGSGVLSIGSDAFYGSYSIPKIFWLGNTPPTGYKNVNASVNYVANDQYSLSNQLKYPFLSSKFSVDGTIYVPVSPSERTCDVVDCEYSTQYADVIIGENVTNRGVEMSVLNINKYAFYDNYYINTLSISNKGNVGDCSFSGCGNLSTVTLGSTVTGILSECFYGCSALTDFTIPDSVTELGASAFQNCSSIENISIGTGVPSLPTRIFSGCSSLKSITVPNNISSVGNYAFYGCSSLGDITIEDAEQDKDTDILTLGSNGSRPLFSDCPLDEVYIGRKLSYKTGSSYGYSPFYRNTSLRTVEITDAETQIYDNEFYGCSNLKTLKIGNGVKSIGDWAFSGCSSLDYFSAGYQVETIGKEAFSDCTGLTKYYSYSIVPPVCGDQAMDDINKWECTLYVPDESSDEYKAAPQWKEFFFIEEMDAVLVAEIRLDVTDITLMPDEMFQLHAEILPVNATDQSVTWSSSDVNVATVSENGLISAIADGTATITVKSIDGNAETTCVVTVDSHNSGIAPVINDPDESIEVFNLNGYKIADSIENLARGIYVVKKGNRTYKIVIK